MSVCVCVCVLCRPAALVRVTSGCVANAASMSDESRDACERDAVLLAVAHEQRECNDEPSAAIRRVNAVFPQAVSGQGS